MSLLRFIREHVGYRKEIAFELSRLRTKVEEISVITKSLRMAKDELVLLRRIADDVSHVVVAEKTGDDVDVATRRERIGRDLRTWRSIGRTVQS